MSETVKPVKSGAEWAREVFAGDHFAFETTGIEVEETRLHYSRLSIPLAEKHRNAMNQVQGGVIFTLADFAFTLAAAYERPITVTLTSNISYMSRVKGQRLIAEANCLREGGHTCYYLIAVTDELGTKVAEVMITGYIMDRHPTESFPEESADNPYREQYFFHTKK